MRLFKVLQGARGSTPETKDMLKTDAEVTCIHMHLCSKHLLTHVPAHTHPHIHAFTCTHMKLHTQAPAHTHMHLYIYALYVQNIVLFRVAMSSTAISVM